MPYVYGQVNADPHTEIWLRVGGYLSVTLLLFAALGLLGHGRRGLKLVLLGWALLVFARIYGVPLLGQVLGVLPGISRIQFYRYGTAALELPVILLAALGLDDVARVPAHRRRVVWGAWERLPCRRRRARRAADRARLRHPVPPRPRSSTHRLSGRADDGGGGGPGYARAWRAGTRGAAHGNRGGRCDRAVCRP